MSKHEPIGSSPRLSAAEVPLGSLALSVPIALAAFAGAMHETKVRGVLSSARDFVVRSEGLVEVPQPAATRAMRTLDRNMRTHKARRAPAVTARLPLRIEPGRVVNWSARVRGQAPTGGKCKAEV